MPERSSVLTGPVPVGGPGLAAHVGALLAADVLVRQAASRGRRLPWGAALVGGGLAGCYAVEEDLVREGLDRAALGRDAFVARAASFEDERRAELAALLAGLGVGLDVEAAAALGAQAAHAARAAFVRLYDAGLVVDDERVVDLCPRCAGVVPDSHAVPDRLGVEALRIRLTLVDGQEPTGRVEVDCLAPELLPGVAGLVVPAGHPAAGHQVAVPLAATVVPVVADASVAAPRLLVPAHDTSDLALAGRLGLTGPAVIDAGGMVRAPGPLDGLARHGARAVATQLLAAEGATVLSDRVEVAVGRCPACGTVLVPRQERHWFLAMAELQAAALDALRAGTVRVAPALAGEQLLAAAGTGEDWCLSQPVWLGEPVPTARCLDCGQVEVAVELAPTCGHCMGEVVADDAVLDARFVGCLLPLAAAGWPAAGRPAVEHPGPPSLFVVAAPSVADVVPMVALGLRLAGTVPFDQVAVGPAGDDPTLKALQEEGGPAARVALLCGGDLAAARAFVSGLEAGRPGPADVDELERAVEAGFEAGTPAAGLGALVAALALGVPATGSGRARALAAPFLGD